LAPQGNILSTGWGGLVGGVDGHGDPG